MLGSLCTPCIMRTSLIARLALMPLFKSVDLQACCGRMPDQHVSQHYIMDVQVIHVLGSYQVYTMPVFDMIEHQVLLTREL